IYGYDLADTGVYDIVLTTDDRTPEMLVQELVAAARRRFDGAAGADRRPPGTDAWPARKSSPPRCAPTTAAPTPASAAAPTNFRATCTTGSVGSPVTRTSCIPSAWPT